MFRRAWYSLFQRFENTIRHQNFPGPNNQSERGIIFPDNTDGGKLKKFLTDMRSRNLLMIGMGVDGPVMADEPIQALIEDPVMRDSRDSYLIQVADCATFLLKQSIEPSTFMRRHGGNAYFQRLMPVLCTVASRKDPSGYEIVRLP